VATNIGLAAFAGTALSTLSLPEALSIGGQAFRGCTALETLSLPKAASIGQYAFWGTGGQALEITLGAAAPTLGPQMFYDVAVLKSVTVKVPSSGATGYGSIPAAYTETNSPYTINWGNGFRGGGWNGSAMLSYDVNSNITLRVVSEGYPYDSVTVNLPGLEDGKVEQPLSGGTTFYGPGAVFTATVSGSSVASQTVAWSVNGTNLDAETTITGGVLSVAAADHGKTITVTATSAEDGITSGKVNIAVAVVMPSDFYGTWTASDFGITWTLVFTSADVHCSKSNSAQYTVTFTGITGVLNTINASKADYPAGFRFTGTAGNVSGPSTGGWDADGPVNVVDGGSGPLTVCLHKTDKGMMLQKSLSTPFAKQL
jgi:hypothetical protein